MKLDLSGKGKLDRAQLDTLNEIAGALRAPFNELIHRLTLQHGATIDWWVTPIASRNVFSCALFRHCCSLVLARKLAAGEASAPEIIVDSSALAAVLTRALRPAYPGVSVRTARAPWRLRLALIAGMGYRYLSALYHCASQFACSRLAGPVSARPPAEPLFLVDTFVYADSFDGAFRDRYYPGLLDCLDDGEKAQVFFAPTFYKVRHYARLFSALRRSGVNFLLKEDFLRPADYAHALAHPFRTRRFTVEQCEFLGFDIAPLVNEALAESFASSGSIEGMLRYRYARRLRERGIALRLVVDWFENQELDHGSNAGFREYFPQTPVVGYQGFVVSRHYLCLFATRDEHEQRVIPQRVAVIGPGLVAGAREFCPQLDVIVAPAFRFSGVWRAPSREPDPAHFTVLVSLPLMRRESAEILELLAAAEFPAGTNGKQWRLWVKLHPAAPAGWPPALPGAAFVAGEFDALLEQADVLVSSASSGCMEAIAKGVPAIVLGSRRGITQNPIPAQVAAETWALCYTADELIAALRHYAGRDAATVLRHRALGAEVRANFFAPVTRGAVHEFLMLDAAAGGK